MASFSSTSTNACEEAFLSPELSVFPQKKQVVITVCDVQHVYVYAWAAIRERRGGAQGGSERGRQEAGGGQREAQRERKAGDGL